MTEDNPNDPTYYDWNRPVEPSAAERLAADDERLAAELRARGWTVIPPAETP